MKTALTELIEDVNSMAQGLNEDELLVYFNRRAKELLEAEKKQIMEAYEAGHIDGYELGKYNEDEIYPESSYYQQTYNQEQ